MNNIMKWDNLAENPVFKQLPELLNIQKEKDKVEIPDLDLEELEIAYNLYEQKMVECLRVGDKDIDVVYKFVQLLYKIDSLDITAKEKLRTMLSCGVLFTYFGRILERTDEEIMMLAFSSAHLDLEDYTYYVGILSNQAVAEAIVEKSDDLYEQREIANKVMDRQDEFDYDYITPDNFGELVQSGLNVVSAYTKSR